MSLKKTRLWIASFLCLLLISACTEETAQTEEAKQLPDEQKQTVDFEDAVEMKNMELETEPLKLTSYSEEIGATLTQPTHTNFAASEVVTIEGTIEQHEQLKENFVWIKMTHSGNSLTESTQDYYVPIQDGKFKQEVTFFNGEGEYHITILTPSKDQVNYYYDLAQFKVFNVNSTIQRDITYTPFGQEAKLTIQDPSSGYVIADKVFTLSGKINSIDSTNENVMLELIKDGESWKHVLPIKNNEFSYELPLFFGKGVHKLTVYVPDQEQENYYQEGSILYIDNESDFISEPITYTTTYAERGVTLSSPTYGGEQTELTYRIKGTIDKDAPFAKETDHLYITTKKDGEEALAVIPVTDYNFDDEFYLRFGPGVYEVTVSVPKIKEENSAQYYYYHVAQFNVTNIDAKDQRDSLPSRGVQSDSPEIMAIAKKLMTNTMSNREKAKAVYEYTAKTISYDVKKQQNNEFEWDDSALKVLNLKTGICQDYTYLALALLRAGGMEARYVAGTAGSGDNFSRHAWVEVKVDDKWLTMDPTWGSGYVKNGAFVANYSEVFFEPTAEAFKTHTRQGVEY